MQLGIISRHLETAWKGLEIASGGPEPSTPEASVLARPVSEGALVFFSVNGSMPLIIAGNATGNGLFVHTALNCSAHVVPLLGFGIKP